MCRNIRTLANFEPPATPEEIHAAALQFVRKVSGLQKPSARNQEAFDLAVGEVARSAGVLLESLQIASPPRNREVEAARAKELSRKRFA